MAEQTKKSTRGRRPKAKKVVVNNEVEVKNETVVDPKVIVNPVITEFEIEPDTVNEPVNEAPDYVAMYNSLKEDYISFKKQSDTEVNTFKQMWEESDAKLNKISNQVFDLNAEKATLALRLEDRDSTIENLKSQIEGYKKKLNKVPGWIKSLFGV